MNSQEELTLSLWQLTEALAPNRVRRLSIVLDHAADVVEHEGREPGPRGRVRVRAKIERAPVRKPEPS